MTHTAAWLTREVMPPFVSTSAIVLQADHVLMLMDPIRKEAVLPGGHLKWREMPEAAVVREVWEETGYTITPRRLVGVFAGEPWESEPGIVRVIYEASASGGSLTPSAEGEPVWLPVETVAATNTRDGRIIAHWRQHAGEHWAPV